MYADRYTGQRGLNPGGVALSLGACGVLLFGLTLTAPHFVRFVDGPIRTINIPIDEPPPPKPQPTQQPKAKPVESLSPPPEHPDTSHPPFKPIDTAAGTPFTPPSGPPLTAGTGDVGTIVTPPHVPIVAGPQLDPRYAGAFQPLYPADERLAGREGRVVVRVLIGTDGRVKDVQEVSAASPAFYETTRRRALEKWRFKPGTRDGVAVEVWKEMAVRFVLDEE
jgi:protein TonB